MTAQAIVLTLALVAGVPLLAWALIRDCERAEYRAWQRRVRASSPFAQIAADFERFAQQVGEIFLPVMTEMARNFAAIGERLRPVAAWVNAEDVPAWRRPVVRYWRRHGWRWSR